jgi:hypothetical protein
MWLAAGEEGNRAAISGIILRVRTNIDEGVDAIAVKGHDAPGEVLRATQEETSDEVLVLLFSTPISVSSLPS